MKKILSFPILLLAVAFEIIWIPFVFVALCILESLWWATGLDIMLFYTFDQYLGAFFMPVYIYLDVFWKTNYIFDNGEE